MEDTFKKIHNVEMDDSQHQVWIWIERNFQIFKIIFTLKKRGIKFYVRENANIDPKSLIIESKPFTDI